MSEGQSTLRILFAADTPRDPDSGAAGTDLRTVEALRDRGHYIEEVWSDGIPRRISHGNLHYVLELPRGYRALVASRLTRARFDIVMMSQPHAFLAARWVRRHAPGTRFVSRSHGWEAHVRDALTPWRQAWDEPEWSFPRGLLGRPLQARIMHHCDRITREAHGIMVSATACRDFIVKRHGVSPDRIACVAQAPPDGYRTQSPAPMDDLRAGRLLLVGQADFIKGFPVARRVLASLGALDKTWSATWVCRGEDHARIRTAIGQDATRRISLRSWEGQSELMRIYDSHGILLFPSFFEGFGKVFLEAMSRGLCVVASDVGGMRDVITHGRDGFLVRAGDLEGFTALLRELLSDRSRVRQVGAAARETALHYSWARVGAETEEFLVRLARMRP